MLSDGCSASQRGANAAKYPVRFPGTRQLPNGIWQQEGEDLYPIPDHSYLPDPSASDHEKD